MHPRIIIIDIYPIINNIIQFYKNNPNYFVVSISK